MSRSPLRLRVTNAFWAKIRAGESIEDAARAAGISITSARRLFRKAGGIMPPISTSQGRYLSLDEREYLHELFTQRKGVREIARTLGRAPSTISKELKRGKITHGRASRPQYSPARGQTHAEQARRGPRRRKLVEHTPLREYVQQALLDRLSPEQIAGRLRIDSPDDLEMRVSHETIYQALYVQGRGELKRELVKHLRTGRTVRKPRRREGERRGRIPGMVMISERPPEVEDRAVPGHWEGDLILGSTASGSAIGTLVERTTGYVLLLHLPEHHTALAVQDAMVRKMRQLPELLKRSITWDQGQEMTNHRLIADQTGLDIYFCDPHSPWQRGSNENTNGLLRQYFPKGTDLSLWGAGILDQVATELNNRPRKRHGFHTPAEVLATLLEKANQPPVLPH